MEDLKKKIIDLLNNSTEDLYCKGSCGELGESCKAIDSELFNKLTDEIIELIENKPSFEDACNPLIKWLCENKHPHTTVILTSNRAELVEGIQCYNTVKYILD